MIRELSIDVSESLQSALKKFETVHEKYLILKDQDKFSGLLSLTSLRRACLKVNVPVTEDIPLSAIAPELCSSFIYDFEKDKNVFAGNDLDFVPVLNTQNQIVDLRFKPNAQKNIELPIRQLKKEDLPIVEQFFAQMGGESRSFFNKDDGNRKFLVNVLSDENNTDTIVFAAIGPDGCIAGLCFLIDLNSGVPWVGIAIAEDWKGHHLGRRLLAYLDQYAGDNGYGALMLITAVSNQRGQGLYERMGYRRLGIHSCGEVLYIKRYPHTRNREKI